MSKARKGVILIDYFQLGKVAFASIGSIKAAQVLVTDARVEQDSLLAALEEVG